MPETSIEVICRYLQDAVAAEAAFESQLRSFAEQGDDSEVQTTFAAYAQQTAQQRVRLESRLQQLGGEASTAKGLLAHLFSFGPKAAQLNHIDEERIAQNLIAAYATGMGHSAMYQALSVAAEAAGDAETKALASENGDEERFVSTKVWHFLVSRSKIAFNMLTSGEIDPAVETKAPDDRLFS